MQKNKLIIDYIKENIDLGINSKFIDLDKGNEKSLVELYENSKTFAQHLDYYHPDKIMIILPNSIDFIEIMVAIFMKGAIFCPIPYFLEKQEFIKLIKYVGPKLIITDRSDIKNDFSNQIKVTSPEELLTNKEKFSLSSSCKIEGNQAASLYYSSGTTGNPKGVLYSHYNISSLIQSIVCGFKFNKNDRHLTMLPFGHTASINYNILPSLMTGNDILISSGFEKLRTNFFATLAKHEITYTQIVPTILFLLNKMNINIDELNLKKLKFIGCGSSLLPITSQKEFIKKYNIKISNLYGLSETGPSHIDHPEEEGWFPGSIGKPLSVNKCKLSDDGEMLIKGDNVFIGYHENERLYKEVVKDGWFHTGDICEYKDDKYWYLDRKKDLIIKSGVNIHPSEIEEIIYEIEGVIECGVIPIPDEIQGDKIIAIVVCKKDQNKEILKEKIKKSCKSKLSNYKLPSLIEFWDELPKTPSKKISRRKIKHIYLEY